MMAVSHYPNYTFMLRKKKRSLDWLNAVGMQQIKNSSVKVEAIHSVA